MKMIDKLENIKDKCPGDTVLMGLDVGTKTIGIALTDSAHSIAMPLKTLKRKKFTHDLRQIENIAKEYSVGGYVIGYPINMDGTEGPKCQSIRDFAIEFENQLCTELKGNDIWIALLDERLSTNSVEIFVSQSVDISKRRAKDKGIIDKLAAQVILQNALNLLSSKS